MGAYREVDASCGIVRHWMRALHFIPLGDASVSICQTWRSKDWSTSGKLLSIDVVEQELGDRLRLPK